MNLKYVPHITAIVLTALILLGAVNAIAASNTMTSTHLSEQSTSITINDKKPAICTMTLTAIVICTGGSCNGSNANDLILGSAGYDSIKAKNGDDCIVAGDGDDDISGDNGTDVCIGGPGNDIFDKCETEIDP